MERKHCGAQVGASGAIDRPVDATARDQRRIGRVDDRVYLEGRDVNEACAKLHR
jgi:hypothetical protein